MLDGAELGLAIAAQQGNLEAALTAFEQAMFARSATASVEALKTFQLCFDDDDAPYGLLDLFSGGSASPST
jgi:hypothetical protein